MCSHAECVMHVTLRTPCRQVIPPQSVILHIKRVRRVSACTPTEIDAASMLLFFIFLFSFPSPPLAHPPTPCHFFCSQYSSFFYLFRHLPSSSNFLKRWFPLIDGGLAHLVTAFEFEARGTSGNLSNRPTELHYPQPEAQSRRERSSYSVNES